jgi:hypothetical protein
VLSVSTAPIGAPSSAGGRTFQTPGGAVSMTVLAQPNATTVTASELLTELKAQVHTDGGTLTYSTADGAVAAVSGYQDGNSTIFYTRDVVTPSVIYSLAWLFPTTLRSTYTSVVDHTAQTFNPDGAPPSAGTTDCPHIAYGADGTAGPLFCSNGQPNPPVLAYYRHMQLGVMTLGTDATPTQVLNTMCADLPHSSFPIETDAYDLAAELKQWSFGINPAQEMTQGGCNE